MASVLGIDEGMRADMKAHKHLTLLAVPVDSSPPISAPSAVGALSWRKDGCHAPHLVSSAPTSDPLCIKVAV